MSDWCLESSIHSDKVINPIRDALERIKKPTAFHKPVYSLSLGDPSLFEDFRAYPFVINAVVERLTECTGNGYSHMMGSIESRQCLANEFSYENIKLTTDDVILDNSGGGAINTIIQVLLNPGDNILIPSPGFPLYRSVALSLHAEARLYTLLPHRNWEIDFSSLEAQYSDRTKLLVIINPSNPCGSVFSKSHLLEILQWAESKKLPILSDEMYHNMTFGKPHYPLGSLTDNVPVFTVGGLSKMFLVPGWRVGWILIYDKHQRCGNFRRGIYNMKSMTIHPCHFIMQAIPKIFADKPKNYFEEVMEKVKVRAELVQRKLEGVKGVFFAPPEGALYAMVSLDFSGMDIKDSVRFAERLAQEQGVMVMPAEVFSSHSGFRVVLCHPVYVLEECMDRIKEFVEAHSVKELED